MMRKENIKVCIIGGGPAGIAAAIAAAKKGAKVIILEKGSSLGRKILISGNGRCNLSNTELSWRNYHGKHPKFTASIFSRFSNEDTLDFFKNLGLETKVEDKGRVFPVSDQAESVLDVLMFELESFDISILCKSKVVSIEKNKAEFVTTLFNGKKIKSDKVIIATGGKSYPSFGSTGDGYKFAKSFGHSIEPFYPVSTGLIVEGRFKPLCNKLQGVKVEAEVKAKVGDLILDEQHGTVLFTHFGLSAWAIMKLSFKISYALNILKNETVDVLIDFFPQYTVDQIEKVLEDRWRSNPKKSLGFSFIGLLPKKLAPELLRFSGYDESIKVAEVSKKHRKEIAELLKSFNFSIVETQSWDEAQFTAGGVSVEEIDSKTMESKIMPGLYFAGEIVGIVGDSGGYNLQWAWSSGYVAGSSI